MKPAQLLDDHHVVFRRGDDVAVVHRLSLQKVYLTAQQWERDGEATLDRFDPVSLERPPPRPKVLQSVVTAVCNYRCRYCSVIHNPVPPAERPMTTEVAREVIATWRREFPRGDGLHIITGGEPLLNWPVMQQLIGEIDTNTVLFTNGALLTDEKARWLAHHRVNVLVSLDGPPDVHDHMRLDTRDNDTAGIAIAGYQRAQDAGCETGISMVVGAHNAARVLEVVEQLLEDLKPASLGVNQPHFSMAYPRCELDVDRYAADMVALFRLARDRRLFLYPITKFVRPIVQERFKWADCSGTGEKLVVFPDGHTSNCINCTPVDGDRPIDVWRHDVPAYHPICRGCHALAMCGGGCLFDGKLFTAVARGEDPRSSLGAACIAPPATWNQWKGSVPRGHGGDGREYALERGGRRGAGSVHGFDLRFCRATHALMEELVWDIFDEFGHGMPSVEQLAGIYAPFLSQSAAARGLSIGVGHETTGE